MKKKFVVLGVAALVSVVLAATRMSTVSLNGKPPDQEQRSKIATITSAPPSPCGPGLAAQDLAGNCRARPNPTPGALEAVSAPRQAMAKTPAQAKPKPVK